MNMKARVGLYKFGRHRNLWGIWQYDWVSETGSSATFVKDVFSYEEAVCEVYVGVNQNMSRECTSVT